MAPCVGLSVFEEAMARTRQRLLVSGLIFQGNPVTPAPRKMAVLTPLSDSASPRLMQVAVKRGNSLFSFSLSGACKLVGEYL